MIFVDTSVWIAAFRDAGSSEARGLSHLLDRDEAALAIPVFLELLSGASRSQRGALQRLLAAVPIFYPAQTTWRTAQEWIGKAVDSGDRFGVADLLVAAIAAEKGARLWSLDHDFARMARLEFVSLFEPEVA